MPGHIYAQSDKIDEAIDAFAAAAENELKWINADVLYPNGHHGHNVHFLVQSLNLDGRYRDSMKRVRHMMSFKESPRERTGNNQRTPYRQGYFSLIKTLVRFETWDAILDGTTLPVYDKPEQKAWRTGGRLGLASDATGQDDAAREALADMESSAQRGQRPRRSRCSSPRRSSKATSPRACGDRKKGFELLRKAADREAEMIYTEPPSYPRPAVEGLANVALALGDVKEAERGYREALEREPGSGRAYFGLAATFTAAGRAADAREMSTKGLRAWDKADDDLPQLRSAKTATAAAR